MRSGSGTLCGCWCLLFVFFVLCAPAQPLDSSVSDAAVRQTIAYLTAPETKGRGNYTKEASATAGYIAKRFSTAGLKPYFRGTYAMPFAVKNSAAWTRDSLGNYNPENVLLNVVGVLEGKSKPEEIVVFSAHYDHLGVLEQTVYPGANDNASGTTAVLLLADYFARQANNERTLVFCAFAGEELGLLGSQAFVKHINADAVVAAVNIEMIGTAGVGKRSVFVTGERHSNFAEIFKRNLPTDFKLRREPAEEKQLFQRSDNLPFARLGVPAHTVMSSDDSEWCYHKPCDNFAGINIGHLTSVIKVIALSCQGLISGRDTPSRILPSSFQ